MQIKFLSKRCRRLRQLFRRHKEHQIPTCIKQKTQKLNENSKDKPIPGFQKTSKSSDDHLNMKGWDEQVYNMQTGKYTI